MSQTSENRIATNASRIRANLTNSTVTYHVVGALLTTILLAGIYWISQNRLAFSGDQSHTQSQIDEATKLISQAGLIQRKLGEVEQLSTEQQSKVQIVQDWLPQSIDFDRQRSSIQSMAGNCGLQWHGLQREGQHDGVRLSVVSATCHVTGTFEQICLLLHKLPTADAPVWCDGISLRHSHDDQSPMDTCEATLTLRLPFAGQNTIAKKLAQAGQPNAI